jgi:hypothetical protein
MDYLSSEAERKSQHCIPDYLTKIHYLCFVDGIEKLTWFLQDAPGDLRYLLCTFIIIGTQEHASQFSA